MEKPKYGVLFSVRHKAKETNDLVNLISIKFGSSIHWAEHLATGGTYFDNQIIRKVPGEPKIWFKLHGNRFTNFLELYCQDIEVLQAIKNAFPNDFSGEVEVKEGLC